MMSFRNCLHDGKNKFLKQYEYLELEEEFSTREKVDRKLIFKCLFGVLDLCIFLIVFIFFSLIHNTH